ncbi:MAG TPA: hypothetical protein VH249_06240 [Xanthobacteraceae bacterium]|jgi:hypothetical protein|nr:hypothetical protein [Xanthobacteraceae bacterium]
MRVFFLPTMMVVTLLGSFGAAIAANPQPDANLFRLVEGTWGWKDVPASSCEQNPHVLSFAEGDKKMILKYPKTGAQYVYQVLYAEKNQITMLIQDEERRTEPGDRVMWVLVLNDKSTYQWRRTDWKSDARTKEIIRCPGR